MTYITDSVTLSGFDLVWLDKHQFTSAIQAKGAPLSQCIGFIDGKIRLIAQLAVNQRIMFSGHKRVHCLKFISSLVNLHRVF